MIVSNKDEIKGLEIKDNDMRGVKKKILIGPEEGWEGYVMRIFEVEENGYTARHKHPWPHINYIIKGKGEIEIEGKRYEIKEGSFAYIPSNKTHQFTNIGNETLEFICIVPEEGNTKR
ncbi:MAG: cupin domain-containing protein [Thermoanaerobacteraceae bacterium]